MKNEDRSLFWVKPQALDDLVARLEGSPRRETAREDARDETVDLTPTVDLRLGPDLTPRPEAKAEEADADLAAEESSTGENARFHRDAKIDSTQSMRPLKIPASEEETAALYALDLKAGAFEPPEAALETRLAALLDWLEEAAQYDQAFVADPEGLALIGDRAADELVAAVVSLGDAWRRIYSDAGLPADAPLAIDLPGERRLHIFSGDGPFGVVRLGFLTPKPLTRPVSDAIRNAFLSTLKEPKRSTHE